MGIFCQDFPNGNERENTAEKQGQEQHSDETANRGKRVYKETEQKNVKAAILDLQDLIDSSEQEQHGLQQFLKNVRKYTDPQELTAKILNDLVDKIVVHAPDKSSGHRKQKIEIYYKAAGIINIADEDCIALDGRLGMQNAKRKQPDNAKRRHILSATPPPYIKLRYRTSAKLSVCFLFLH